MENIKNKVLDFFKKEIKGNCSKLEFKGNRLIIETKEKNNFQIDKKVLFEDDGKIYCLSNRKHFCVWDLLHSELSSSKKSTLNLPSKNKEIDVTKMRNEEKMLVINIVKEYEEDFFIHNRFSVYLLEIQKEEIFKELDFKNFDVRFEEFKIIGDVKETINNILLSKDAKNQELMILHRRFPAFNGKGDHVLHIGEGIDYEIYSDIVNKIEVKKSEHMEILKIFKKIKKIEEDYLEILKHSSDEYELKDMILILLLADVHGMSKDNASFIKDELINEFSRVYRVQKNEIVKTLLKISIINSILKEKTDFFKEIKDTGDLNILLAKKRNRLKENIINLRIENKDNCFYFFSKAFTFLIQ